MKRKFNLVISVLLIVALLFTGCSKSNETPTQSAGNSTEESKADDGKVYEMKISHLTTETDPLHIGYVYLSDILEEKTNGRIKVTIYGNKQLANSDREQAEMVQNGLAQLGTTPAFTVAALNSELNEFFIYDYPYLMPDTKKLYEFTDSDLGVEMRKEASEKLGMKVYPGFPLGWVKISSNKQPINEPADLKGLKIRTTSSELYMEFVRQLGANPTPVNYGELFTALQQGTVDGMMTTTSLYQSDRFYEVQKYMGVVDPFTIFHTPLVNAEWFESLPDDLKPIFEECMAEYIVKMRELEDEKELIAKKAMVDNGMVVTEYTEEQKQKFIEAGLNTCDKMANVAGEDFVNKVKDFVNK